MTIRSSTTAKDAQSETAALLKQLHATQQRLQELNGGRGDAEFSPDSQASMQLELQQKLRESEEKFRGLFAAAGTAIAISTPKGRYLHANAAYCRMLGYTEEELKKLDFAALTHPDDLEINLRLRDAMIGGARESFFMEKRYVKKGGDPVWVRAGVSATRDLGGTITSLTVIAEDIGERKLAEHALRHSEERLRLITNLVPHGIFAKDSAGRHIFANPALAELAGLSIEEILGKDDFELVADRAQAEAFRKDDLAVIQSGMKMVISEEPRTDLTGRTRLLQTMKIPFTLAETGESAVLGVCIDITEQKRTEARFRRLVDSNVQGVFFWHTNGQITGANDSFLRMVGYTRDDLNQGRLRWVELTPPEQIEQDRRALKQLATAGVCEPFEKEFFRQDGSRVPILIGPAMFEDNRDEGFCFVLDLSERKKLEQQFLRAQRMESIGTLAGGIAHDINNILAPIMLSIEMLRHEFATPETDELLETISASAKRGAGIVRQVLSFARGVDPQRTQVQPQRLFRELESIIKETFPKDIEVLSSVPDDVWTLHGDPTQVQQVLLNLCVNARDAMPSGGRLMIDAKNCALDEQSAGVNIHAKAGRYVCLSVTDSGTGMPKSVIDKIFEPFFTTKAINKGTGLGLSTAIAIVRSHEGSIDVESEPGRGTTFKVYLPAAESSSEAQPKEPQQNFQPRGNGQTILIVDDEPSVLNITGRALESFGYRILTAQNGAEALAVYAEKKQEIAVVLTDMMMPTMDGASLIRALLSVNPTVKIVRASGFFADFNSNSSSESVVKHMLAKPYTAEALFHTIRAVLEEA